MDSEQVRHHHHYYGKDDKPTIEDHSHRFDSLTHDHDHMAGFTVYWDHIGSECREAPDGQ